MGKSIATNHDNKISSSDVNQPVVDAYNMVYWIIFLVGMNARFYHMNAIVLTVSMHTQNFKRGGSKKKD